MKQLLSISLVLFTLSFITPSYGGSSKLPTDATIHDIVKSAEEGDIHGKFVIGRSVLFDKEILGEKYKDRDQALKWLNEVIDEAPFYGGRIGFELAQKNRPVLAQRYLQKAIRNGHTLALRFLAGLYLGSQHSKEGNLLAKTYFEAAISYGESYGYVEIGYMHIYGFGVKQDYKMAEKYFKKAIYHGDTSGYSAIAIMKERFLPNPDYKEILDLFLKDAPSGHPIPIMGIKRLYEYHPKETGLTQEDVLFWKYVQRFQLPASLRSRKDVINKRSKYHEGLSDFKITEIKRSAEALVKSFSNDK